MSKGLLCALPILTNLIFPVTPQGAYTGDITKTTVMNHSVLVLLAVPFKTGLWKEPLIRINGQETVLWENNQKIYIYM